MKASYSWSTSYKNAPTSIPHAPKLAGYAFYEPEDEIHNILYNNPTLTVDGLYDTFSPTTTIYSGQISSEFMKITGSYEKIRKNF